MLQEPSIHCFGKEDVVKSDLKFSLKFSSLSCKDKIKAKDDSILHKCEIELPIHIIIFKNFI